MTIEHPKGGERMFLRKPILMGGQHIPVHQLWCSEPGCRNGTEIIDRNDRSLPNHFVKRKFEQKGWTVGQNDKNDLCPEHTQKKAAERRAKNRRNSSTVIEAEALFKKPASQGEATMAAPAPEAMSRDDRRIIFAKLSEVYIDASQGYQTPWTDKKVGEDLGVPVGWVSDLRNDMFGPAADNAEVREFLAKAEKLVDKAAGIIIDAGKVHAEITSLIGKANNINGSIQEIKRQVDLLNTQGARIRASLEP